MLSNILQEIGSVLTEVVAWIVDIIEDVVPIFYTAGTSNTPGSFTFLGVLLLVSFGLGMVWTLINFIRGLVRRA